MLYCHACRDESCAACPWHPTEIVFRFSPRSKPAGLQAARKLRNHRREQRWAQKAYNKSHSITAMKANPFGGATMAKGIVLEKM